jgi:HK97 family phage major capsid protein
MPESRTTETPERNYTLEDLRGRTPEEVSDIIDVTKAQIRAIHQTPNGELRSLDAAEERALQMLLEVHEAAEKMYEEHRKVNEVLRRRPAAIEYSRLGGQKDDPFGDVRRLSVRDARDRALRTLEARENSGHMSAEEQSEADKQIRHSTDIARRVLVTETEEYREAWLKLVTHPRPFLTPEESRAVQAWEEYRAMSENTTTAGGFGIPVFIDPSIILTAQESGNPFLELARQVNVNTNQWKGVSSAGVTWAFQTESAAATDNSPTLAQPTVTVHMARGFIPFSIEVDQDYPSFASEMSRLLAVGYDELLVDKFTRGSGTGEPQGILTALSANTNVRVGVQTSGAFGETEPYRVMAALPQKYRRRANWLMSISVNNAIRQLAKVTGFHAFTENLPAEWADTILGKGVRESPYMPDTTTSTSATTGYAIVGDWDNYLLARRGGMSIELIPHIFDVTSNRPTGNRGWFGYARIGGGSVNDLGFRLLVNTG